MKQKRWQFILLGLYLLVIVLIGLIQPKSINWQPTFLAEDKIPYGNYILRKELHHIFKSSGIEDNAVGFYNFSPRPIKSNYIIIGTHLQADELDSRAMLQFVRNGGNLFIASSAIPQMFEDSLGIQIKQDFDVLTQADSVQTCTLELANPQFHSSSFRFRKEYTSLYIDDIDTAAYSSVLDEENEEDEDADAATARTYNILPRTALGYDDKSRVNFVQIPLGEGNIYVHTFPYAFSNYHMLEGNNSVYIQNCLSYLPVAHTYWDEFYNPYRVVENQTPLRYILSIPGYKWAYFVVVFAGLAYVLFFARRTQRIIPTITAPQNLSLEFTRTIGTLYYQQGNHLDIAEKKMTYFLEKVRTHYHLPTQLLDDNFQRKLAYKSNAQLETVQDIFKIYFHYIREKKHIRTEELIELNKAFEKFYNETGLINK
ncbi:MAG: hypothetical protein RLZZ367_485 [Bacteroidota bacterium]